MPDWIDREYLETGYIPSDEEIEEAERQAEMEASSIYEEREYDRQYEIDHQFDGARW